MNIRLTNEALRLLSDIIGQIDSGFVVCTHCGCQEDTKTLDFADSIKEVKELIEAAL